MTDVKPPEAPVVSTPVTPTVERRYGRVALVGLLAVAFVLFALTLSSIFAPIVLGALMAGFLTPLRNRMTKRLGGRSVAAAVATVALLLGALAPLAFVVIEVVLQLDNVLSNRDAFTKFLGPDGPWQSFLAEYPSLKRLVPANKITEQVTAALSWLGKGVPTLLSGTVDFFFNTFITLLTTYYLLRDGSSIGRRVEAALPIEPRHTRALAREFGLVGRAVVIGSLGTALAQGVVGGMGFWALGLEQPLLLGTLTAALALVPAVGSGLVWVPVALYLLATGDTTRGFILIAFGLLVVSTIDNVVRPLLARADMATHPLLIFLGLFGGLASFGLSGLYLGPLFVALFTAIAKIYERELAPSANVLVPALNESAPLPSSPTLTTRVTLFFRRRKPSDS